MVESREQAEDRKQNFMEGIKDKVVVIARGKHERVMALVRRSARPPGMPDAFDRAPPR